MLRLLRNLGIACAVAIVSTLAVSAAWTAIGGGEMSVHGWIALSLGVFGTVGLAWLLMTLAFKSDREGWDQRVDNTLDPGMNPGADRSEERRP
jgi:hypothetical protein